jgi:hypothetical protein
MFRNNPRKVLGFLNFYHGTIIGATSWFKQGLKQE